MATVTPTIDPNFSFVTQSSLIFQTSSPSNAMTITNPDQATTTIALPNPTAAATATQVPLPTGIPSRIYPQNGVDGSAPPGFTLISLLFNQDLNWNFVVQHQETASQLFAFVPVILQGALGITSDQVKTYALQVYVPATYQGPSDVQDLGTIYLGYIPTNLVDTLAAMIKARSSAFYTGQKGVAAQIAARVDPAFPITAIPDPNKQSGGGNGQGASNGISDQAKVRHDAIIGVVSALGGVALIVLSVLVYRSYRRRQELAHRRLSDPPAADPTGLRPEGREFDQDSVGGQRRRSFYYAEDSLQGYQGQGARQEEGAYDYRSGTNGGMTQRRNVMPTAISAPILQGSTMNW